MNSNNENKVLNEFDETGEQIVQKKLNHWNILIFLGCIIIAFAVWCYAGYLKDPIVAGTVKYRFELERSADVSYMIENSIKEIHVYGRQSAFKELEKFSISTTISLDLFDEDGIYKYDLSKSDFGAYNGKIYSDQIIEVRLVKKDSPNNGSENSTENNNNGNQENTTPSIDNNDTPADK